jgi:hypothetical protein
MKLTGEIPVWHGAAIILTLILPCGALAQSPAAVLTGQYNNYRTSANLNESILTPANVSAGTFGLLFTQSVDADIFAQPLYVPALTINGALHNAAFVATLNNSVYAFDADTSQPALWHASLGAPVRVGTSSEPTVGILSTPVIDIGLGTLFVVTFTSESGSQVYRLHALNLLTGAEIANIVVQGAVAGTGDDSQGTPCLSWNGGAVPPPCIPFKPREQLQRPALLEGTAHTTIYLAFGSLSGQEVTTPYHGWLMGYQYAAGAFQQTLIFNSTQSATQEGPLCSADDAPANQCGHGGGIWMSGRGPALDAAGLYVVTGNGGYGGAGTGNWGESALRLNGAGAVEDSFTPYNYGTLNRQDLDLCSGGIILFSGSNTTVPNLALVAGKTGVVSVMNRANMGGVSTLNTATVQTFNATTSRCGTGASPGGCYEIHSPAFWSRPGGVSRLYVWAQEDVLRVWDFVPGSNFFRLDPNQGTLIVEDYPGGGLAVSANGNDSGILWAILATGDEAQGTLSAFDATNVSTPLWVSTDYWFPTKFTIPTVVNGKVYVPTSSPVSANPPYAPALRVYGLCGTCAQGSPASRLPVVK